MENTIFHLSFRCYYKDGGSCDKYQDLKLSDIPHWIHCYKFTHPNCTAITIKVWLSDMNK